MSTLRLHKLSKEYDDRRVLIRVSGEFEPGIVALLGPNGAGKSTLLKILSTQMLPSGGHFDFSQLHSLEQKDELRKKIGMIGHQSFLYRALRVRENLQFYARLYQLTEVEEKIERLATQFGLADRLEMLLGQLSRGLLQRVTLIRALLHDPELLLFDEPFTGLDTHSAEQLMELLNSWRGSQKLIFLTTHDLERASRCCDRFLFLSRGRLTGDIQGALTLPALQEHYRNFCQG